MMGYPSGGIKSMLSYIESFGLHREAQSDRGNQQMNNVLLRLYIKLQEFASREDAQDLVEYALIVAVVAFGTTAGMKTLSAGLAAAFSGISSKLSSYVS
jgi:pilus assembly protein Flp/PilA